MVRTVALTLFCDKRFHDFTTVPRANENVSILPPVAQEQGRLQNAPTLIAPWPTNNKRRAPATWCMSRIARRVDWKWFLKPRYATGLW